MTYPAWICRPCGHKYSRPGATFSFTSTYHNGDHCGWCDSYTEAVTEPRDFGYPPYPVPASKSQAKRFTAQRRP